MDLDLTGPWSGWRIRGGFLISPDRDRLSVERLRGLVLTEYLRRTFGPKPVRHGGVALLSDFRRRVESLGPAGDSEGQA